jgi:hypothetical protein
MICSKPDCRLAGVDQPPEAFRPKTRICKDCLRRYKKAYYEANRERIQAERKWIPDDDPEDDLRPISGEADWARITR